MSYLNNSFYINRSKVNLYITQSENEESKSSHKEQENFSINKSFKSEFIPQIPNDPNNSVFKDPNILTCSLSDSKNEIQVPLQRPL